MSVRRQRHRVILARLPRLPRARLRGRARRSGTTHFRGARYKRAIKRATMRDCGRRCVYCATRLDVDTATLDHVYPLAHGGAHHPGNVVLACVHCNQLKSDLLPYDFFMANPWAGANFMRFARTVHRALKRAARRAVSLAYAQEQRAA